MDGRQDERLPPAAYSAPPVARAGWAREIVAQPAAARHSPPTARERSSLTLTLSLSPFLFLSLAGPSDAHG